MNKKESLKIFFLYPTLNEEDNYNLTTTLGVMELAGIKWSCDLWENLESAKHWYKYYEEKAPFDVIISKRTIKDENDGFLWLQELDAVGKKVILLIEQGDDFEYDLPTITLLEIINNPGRIQEILK